MTSTLHSDTLLQATWSTLEDGRRVVSFVLPPELMNETEANSLKNIEQVKNNPFVRYLELQRDFLILERGLHLLPDQFRLNLYCRYYHYDRDLADLEMLKIDSNEDLSSECIQHIHAWLSDCLDLQHRGELISKLVFDFGKEGEGDNDAVHTRDTWTQGLRALYDAQLGQGTWDAWKTHREQAALQQTLPVANAAKSGPRL